MPIGEQSPPLQPEDRIDLRPLVSMLRRRGLVLVFAAVAGGVAGASIAQMTPPQYMGTARLGLTDSLASANAAEVLARFRATLRKPEVIRAAVTGAKAPDVDPDDVLRRVTSRTAGDELTVDVRWYDAEMAATLADHIAGAIVADISQQQAQHRQLSAVTLKAELEEAERALDVARRTLLDFYQTSRLIAALAEVEKLAPAGVARETPEQDNREGKPHPRADDALPAAARDALTVPDVVALNEAALGSLAARSRYLATVVDPFTNERLSRELAQLWLMEAEFTGDYVRALGTRNRLAEAYHSNQGARSGIERRGDKTTSQRVDRITTRSGSILGVVAAFVVALFGVILFDALRRSSN